MIPPVTLKPSWAEAEARQILEDRKRQRDNEWLLGQVGEATYLRGLMVLGYLPADARTELSLLGQPKRSEGCLEMNR